MMQDLMNALPDEKPITSICVVEDPTNCPPGHNLVSRTHDQDTDADLWKDGFFRRVTRYLCISKTVRQQEEHILESFIIINEKDTPPKNYTTIGMTRDTDQPAMKKKQFCIKLGHETALAEALSDIIVLSRSTRNPPPGFIHAGEINGLSICYKLTRVNKSPQKTQPEGPKNANLPYQMGPTVSQGFPTWSPGYRPYENDPRQRNANVSQGYKTAIDGVPFEINPKYNTTNLNSFIVPQINIKSAEQLEVEYGYDFRVEYQAQQRIPSGLQ